ncbi:hypothetical protein [Neorhodopirellula pilleata]|uniref:Curli production assembly/transport component CsgG n=1 Tax=Neorhodopirellula pilleata TaxID=2714738 RepID=A0A5C6ABT0_9BACT|nr:hypothetical protein [Neorhodopirellula pilleata]TWT97502.1 Curli production assembly/transport component CsgG [Neorhodopirellula pilleata]
MKKLNPIVFQSAITVLVGLLVVVAVSLAAGSCLAADDRATKEIVKVAFNDKSIIVGYTIRADDTTVEFFDLKSNKALSFPRTDVKEVSAVDFDQAVEIVGFPVMFSWKIFGLAENVKKLGKIAKVTPQLVYINLGRSQGMRKGAKLSVFRNLDDIVDPETGKVLATERPKIAELTVVEVDQLYCKARMAGDIEVALRVGDEVDVDSRVVVAVCPLVFEDGTTSDENAALEEDLVTNLVNRKITVVDRSNLNDLVTELLVQNTVLFDQESAKKVGELTGASHVVVGKVIPTSKERGTAYVRLVEVETGRILVASTTSIAVSQTHPMTRRRVAVAGVDRIGGNTISRQLPAFLTTQSQYRKTRSGGIRIQGAHESSSRNRNAIQTKDAGFLTKDFVFEVVLEFEQLDREAFVGMGPGLADVSYNGLTDSVYLQLVNPSIGPSSSGGVVLLNRFKLDRAEIGRLPNLGPHLVRIIKMGATVTFQVDCGNDGPTDDDLETTIQDIAKAAPFFHSKNSPLFFGGGSEFSSIRLKP